MAGRVRDRVTFLVERLMLRGAQYRLLVIAVLIGLVSIAAGTLVHLAQSGFDGNWTDAIWWAFLRLTDPGYLGDDQGTLLRTVSTVLTVLGYVIFLGALVAILTQWLNAWMRQLESGHTPISASNHLLILGWTNRTPAIVREILLSEGRVRRFLRRRGARRLRIVVLAEEVTSELGVELRERLGPLWKERQIILRTGTPLRMEHLERVDFHNAAAILLPAADFAQGGPGQADTRSIKTLLSISTHAGRDLPLVVAEIFDARKASVAEHAYGGPIEVLPSDAIISRLIAQNVRHPSLSHVYTELLTHGRGNEIYVRDAGALAGTALHSLIDAFPRAIILGVVRPDGPVLNPRPEFRIEAADKLILVARNFTMTEATPAPPTPVPTPAPASPPRADHHRRILLLGWSHKAPSLLREFDSYRQGGFEVDLLSAVPEAERATALARHDVHLQRVQLRHVEGDYTAGPDLARMEPARYDHVIFLASDWLESGEESDARTILGYLLLREMIGDSARPHVLVELLDPGNVMLFRRRAGEVLISPLILSHMLAQVALRRELAGVFDELFGPEGSEICFQPASSYGVAGREIGFRELQLLAAARAQVALGVRTASARGLLLNPAREQRWTLGAEDHVIVLDTERGNA